MSIWDAFYASGRTTRTNPELARPTGHRPAASGAGAWSVPLLMRARTFGVHKRHGRLANPQRRTLPPEELSSRYAMKPLRRPSAGKSGRSSSPSLPWSKPLSLDEAFLGRCMAAKACSGPASGKLPVRFKRPDQGGGDRTDRLRGSVPRTSSWPSWHRRTTVKPDGLRGFNNRSGSPEFLAPFAGPVASGASGPKGEKRFWAPWASHHDRFQTGGGARRGCLIDHFGESGLAMGTIGPRAGTNRLVCNLIREAKSISTRGRRSPHDIGDRQILRVWLPRSRGTSWPAAYGMKGFMPAPSM